MLGSVLACAALLLGQDPAGPASALGEGPLDNDVWVNASRDAELHLARGDEAFAELARRGLPLSSEADQRAWQVAFEAWHAALETSRTGDGVAPRPWRGPPGTGSPWPDPDGTAGGREGDLPLRRTEGVEYAVLRRLEALAPAVRAAWTRRFEGLAGEALAAAQALPGALEAVERLHPVTPGAARAALSRAEQELEAGRPRLALAWLERAERHARLLGSGPLAEAAARRRAVVEGLLTSPEPGPGAWQRASELRFVAEVPLEDLTQRNFVLKPRPGSLFQPGAAWTDDGLAVVQTQEPGREQRARVVVLDPADGRVLARFDPRELLAAAGIEVELRDPPREPPGWPCVPATSQGRLVLVLRSEPSALLCLRLQAAEGFSGWSLPRLEWAVVGGELRGGDGRPARALPGWPAGDVQPGPLAWGGLVVAQVHEPDAETPGTLRSHAVGLDLATGELRWSRLLARGAPLRDTAVRFLGPASEPTAGQPLARVGARALVGTHLGAAVLLDVGDGRLAWSFKNRRRSPPARGWSGGATPVFETPAAGVVFAPPDSDRAYWLRGAPDLRGEGLLLHAPRAIGEAEVLAGGDARRALVLTRSGRERALAEWDAGSGAVREAAWLGPREVFTGGAAVGTDRVVFATDRGVYLHDRGRELYLLDQRPWPSPFAAPGGEVAARGNRVLVLGSHVAWVLAAR